MSSRIQALLVIAVLVLVCLCLWWMGTGDLHPTRQGLT